MAMFVCHTGFTVGYRVVDKDTMFLPSYLIGALWVGVGYQSLLTWVADAARPVVSRRGDGVILRLIMVGGVLLALRDGAAPPADTTPPSTSPAPQPEPEPPADDAQARRRALIARREADRLGLNVLGLDAGLDQGLDHRGHVVDRGQLVVIDQLSMEQPKTKQAVEMLTNLGYEEQSVLLVLADRGDTAALPAVLEAAKGGADEKGAQYKALKAYTCDAAGKGKNNPIDFGATPDSCREEAEGKGMNPKML